MFKTIASLALCTIVMTGEVNGNAFHHNHAVARSRRDYTASTKKYVYQNPEVQTAEIKTCSTGVTCDDIDQQKSTDACVARFGNGTSATCSLSCVTTTPEVCADEGVVVDETCAFSDEDERAVAACFNPAYMLVQNLCLDSCSQTDSEGAATGDPSAVADPNCYACWDLVTETFDPSRTGCAESTDVTGNACNDPDGICTECSVIATIDCDAYADKVGCEEAGTIDCYSAEYTQLKSACNAGAAACSAADMTADPKYCDYCDLLVPFCTAGVDNDFGCTAERSGDTARFEACTKAEGCDASSTSCEKCADWLFECGRKQEDTMLGFGYLPDYMDVLAENGFCDFDMDSVASTTGAPFVSYEIETLKGFHLFCSLAIKFTTTSSSTTTDAPARARRDPGSYLDVDLGGIVQFTESPEFTFVRSPENRPHASQLEAFNTFVRSERRPGQSSAAADASSFSAGSRSRRQSDASAASLTMYVVADVDEELNIGAYTSLTLIDTSGTLLVVNSTVTGNKTFVVNIGTDLTFSFAELVEAIKVAVTTLDTKSIYEYHDGPTFGVLVFIIIFFAISLFVSVLLQGCKQTSSTEEGEGAEVSSV